MMPPSRQDDGNIRALALACMLAVCEWRCARVTSVGGGFCCVVLSEDRSELPSSIQIRQKSRQLPHHDPQVGAVEDHLHGERTTSTDAARTRCERLSRSRILQTQSLLVNSLELQVVAVNWIFSSRVIIVGLEPIWRTYEVRAAPGCSS